ncbi:HOMEOBOX PROTEIN KNOTTED-1-LIKE 3 ISOFORM X1 [Salix koriyanagi]|uniref:HOMEOBOX PROTEIN KNOTTED-1-LIKE 3 ISOFORM X1 n=1 Tax=Salix koriyanagi TaxID=2511006 RepID=A0A9Q0VCE3_9ROSI|nr:HOMEOBOX PROTEIN KNOTTED-1-LIKE 3 ISOFORM X1 [Salix koriyanagi]
MAFRDHQHIPQEMAFQLPHHHLSASPSTGPTWLSNAVLRRHDDVLTQTRVEKPENNTNNGSEEELIDSVSDDWERAKCKAEILGHPLYEQLLAAHVACLRIATPVDQLARIDTQLAQSQDVVAKYSGVGRSHVVEEKELDQFMVITTTFLNVLLIIPRFVFFKVCLSCSLFFE